MLMIGQLDPLIRLNTISQEVIFADRKAAGSLKQQIGQLIYQNYITAFTTRQKLSRSINSYRLPDQIRLLQTDYTDQQIVSIESCLFVIGDAGTDVGWTCFQVSFKSRDLRKPDSWENKRKFFKVVINEAGRQLEVG